MPNSELEVSLLHPDEVEQYMRIRHEVFRTTVNRILYPRGEPSQKTFDRVAADMKNDIVNKGDLYLKCVDKSTREMIAGARWGYVKPKDENAKERTWEEVDEGLIVPEPYDESEPELWRNLFELFNQHKRDLLANRPYYKLVTCVVLPQHQRRGAGAMLVQWGCEKADEAGVEAYLEASLMGAPLYARYNFKPIKRVELNMKSFGAKQNEQFILMLRPAKADHKA